MENNNPTINLADARYMYSVTGKGFTDYSELATDISDLFENQADGKATFFRQLRPTFADDKPNGKIEQITIEPIEHIKMIAALLRGCAHQCESLEQTNEELEEQVEDLEEDVYRLRKELAQRHADKELALELHHKVTMLGYSAKEVINEVFRDNQLAGGAK